jgi:hypothetical protein
MITTLPLLKVKNLPKKMVRFTFKKHKIYLYKEDFAAFQEILDEMTSYVLDHKGEEVISERHQKDFKKEYAVDADETEDSPKASFTDIDFDDI